MHARHSLAIVAVAGAVALATLPAVAADTVACVKVEVSSATEKNANSADRFSVSTTLDLTLTMLFKPDFAGDHVLELDVFTPDGQLYRSMAVPITTAERKGATRTVPGYPRPMEEQQLVPTTRGRSGFLAVDVPFPVAGTDIVSSGLYGRWRVQARLDGQRNPCAQASTFTLTQ